MDRQHAPTYDEDYGAISATHEAFLARLLQLTRRGGLVLDAACGTGKYWPLILASGRQVVGVDQSAGMLAQAARKHPAVPVARLALQDLDFNSTFDAVTCVDAMENVAPEDWPRVVSRLARAARPSAPAYLTVELEDSDRIRSAFEAARSAGAPVVEGEVFDGVGYHYYPSAEAVRAWLAVAGFKVLEEGVGDDYMHLLVRRTGAAA